MVEGGVGGVCRRGVGAWVKGGELGELGGVGGLGQQNTVKQAVLDDPRTFICVLGYFSFPEVVPYFFMQGTCGKRFPLPSWPFSPHACACDVPGQLEG